jgi:6-phosphogluconolactonase
VVYLISETASTVSAHTLDGAGGQLSLLQAPISTLAMPVSGNTGAEVAVHPSGRFLYGSNRGDDSIALFSLDAAGKMTFVSTTPCGGKTPRHFSIDPTGRWLLVANQGSDSVTVFAIDPVAGGLTATPGAAVFPQPSFVAAFPPQ